MRYLILLLGDGELPAWEEMTAAEQADVYRRFEEFGAACEAREGVEIIAGEELQPGQARTVRTRGGRLIVTEGPFAESIEGLGGMFLISAPDLETLLELLPVLPPYDMQIMPVQEQASP